jgi:hypothetical protein
MCCARILSSAIEHQRRVMSAPSPPTLRDFFLGMYDGA